MNLDELDEIMQSYEYQESGIIAILQDIQKNEKYLPEMELKLIAERIGVPPSRVYGLATFYRAFSLEPQGKHVIQVCLGTACHVRGGARIMDRLARDLEIEPGQTTPDRRFTLESVRCVGCCGLAPVIVIDGNFHSKLVQNKLPRVLKKYP